MARLARVEVFASDEVSIVLVCIQTVRRCFSRGNGHVSGKNFDHGFRSTNLSEIPPDVEPPMDPSSQSGSGS